MSDVSIVPVISLFPGRDRWACEQCRTGRIPGAFKIGKSWFIHEADVERLAASKRAPNMPTVADAEAELRARGVL